MRRRLVLGLGLAGVFSGSAVGQFAAAAKPIQPQTKAAPFGGAKPMSPGYVPPVGGFQPAPAATTGGGFTPAGGTRPGASVTMPAPVEIRSVLGADHPWLLKPEHGKYFICV